MLVLNESMENNPDPTPPQSHVAAIYLHKKQFEIQCLNCIL
jgi:hypothetical protein